MNCLISFLYVRLPDIVSITLTNKSVLAFTTSFTLCYDSLYTNVVAQLLRYAASCDMTHKGEGITPLILRSAANDNSEVHVARLRIETNRNDQN